MPPKGSPLKTLLVNISAVLSGIFGATAVLRTLTRSRHPLRPEAIIVDEDQPHRVGTGDIEARTDNNVPAPSSQRAPSSLTLKPGWQRVDHESLPQPTYWPAAMALAITFLAWGIVTSALISGVGLLLFALALGGWIGDLLHEH